MPVSTRTRRVFRGRIRAQLFQANNVLLRLLAYNTNHPTETLLSAGDITNINAVRTMLAFNEQRTEPA